MKMEWIQEDIHYGTHVGRIMGTTMLQQGL